jgi:hypothetical protein
MSYALIRGVFDTISTQFDSKMSRVEGAQATAIAVAAQQEGLFDENGDVIVERAKKLVVDWTAAEERRTKLKYELIDVC